jgi:hypothetical protein
VNADGKLVLFPFFLMGRKFLDYVLCASERERSATISAIATTSNLQTIANLVTVWDAIAKWKES